MVAIEDEENEFSPIRHAIENETGLSQAQALVNSGQKLDLSSGPDKYDAFVLDPKKMMSFFRNTGGEDASYEGLDQGIRTQFMQTPALLANALRETDTDPSEGPIGQDQMRLVFDTAKNILQQSDALTNRADITPSNLIKNVTPTLGDKQNDASNDLQEQLNKSPHLSLPKPEPKAVSSEDATKMNDEYKNITDNMCTPNQNPAAKVATFLVVQLLKKEKDIDIGEGLSMMKQNKPMPRNVTQAMNQVIDLMNKPGYAEGLLSDAKMSQQPNKDGPDGVYSFQADGGKQDISPEMKTLQNIFGLGESTKLGGGHIPQLGGNHFNSYLQSSIESNRADNKFAKGSIGTGTALEAGSHVTTGKSPLAIPDPGKTPELKPKGAD